MVPGETAVRCFAQGHGRAFDKIPLDLAVCG